MELVYRQRARTGCAEYDRMVHVAGGNRGDYGIRRKVLGKRQNGKGKNGEIKT
jgi:hypothetical protein